VWEAGEVYATLIAGARYFVEPRLRSGGTSGSAEEADGVPDEQRLVVRAAEALWSDERELYELWLKAAEATVAALGDSNCGSDAAATGHSESQCLTTTASRYLVLVRLGGTEAARRR
jgi:hypothetical protein